MALSDLVWPESNSGSSSSKTQSDAVITKKIGVSRANGMRPGRQSDGRRAIRREGPRPNSGKTGAPGEGKGGLLLLWMVVVVYGEISGP